MLMCTLRSFRFLIGLKKLQFRVNIIPDLAVTNFQVPWIWRHTRKANHSFTGVWHSTQPKGLTTNSTSLGWQPHQRYASDTAQLSAVKHREPDSYTMQIVWTPWSLTNIHIVKKELSWIFTLDTKFRHTLRLCVEKTRHYPQVSFSLYWRFRCG